VNPTGRAPLNLSAPMLVRAVLVLGTLEGITALCLTLARPSDVESRALGPYSAERWGLLVALATLTLGFCLVTLTSIRTERLLLKLARLLFYDQRTLPRAFTAGLLALVVVVALLGVFFPQVVITLNGARLSRLAPLLLWVGACFAQLALAWVLLFHREWLRPPHATMDGFALLAIAAAALAVRVPATSFGLPYEAMWDEVVTYPRSLQSLVISGKPSLEVVPGYGNAGYGDILVGITTASSVVGLLDSFRTQTVSSIAEYVSPPPGVSSVLQAVHHSGNPLRYPRLAFALINSLAPLLIYIILRRHFATPWLAASAGAMAYALFSADVVSLSSFILPDSLAATLMLASLLFALEGSVIAKDAVVPWIASGLFAGMAASTSLRSITIAVLPVGVLLFSTGRRRLPAQVLSLTASLVAGYMIASPSLLIDLPAFLSRTTDLTWLQDASLQHRAESIVYYVQALFSPTSGGFGIGILALTIAGLLRSVTRFPRTLLAVSFFVAVHLYAVTPVVVRYSRHILVLSPLACIFAGIGLAAAADWLQGRVAIAKSPPVRAQVVLVPGLLVVLLALASSAQLRKTLQTVDGLRTFVPSQVHAVRFLKDTLRINDVVGLQQELPIVERDLYDRGLRFERIASDATVADLRSRGIAYVVGSSQLGGEYALPPTGLWHGAFEAPGTRLAEFGTAPLLHDGWPSADLFMFVARVPGE
jgi:hypothetical protein